MNSRQPSAFSPQLEPELQAGGETDDCAPTKGLEVVSYQLSAIRKIQSIQL
jgi:hypothetical protein